MSRRMGCQPCYLCRNHTADHNKVGKAVRKSRRTVSSYQGAISGIEIAQAVLRRCVNAEAQTGQGGCEAERHWRQCLRLVGTGEAFDRMLSRRRKLWKTFRNQLSQAGRRAHM
jgi:hypothetical protein